jgi:hypothetical protein
LGASRVLQSELANGYRIGRAPTVWRARSVVGKPRARKRARQLPHRTKDERAARRAAFDAVVAAHGFTAGAAQSFASSLHKSWVREQPRTSVRVDVNTAPSGMLGVVFARLELMLTKRRAVDLCRTAGCCCCCCC